MNASEINTLCIACLGKHSEMFPLTYSLNETSNFKDHEKKEANKTILEILSQVLCLTEHVSEKYPQNICSMCLEILNVVYDFKLLFEESHKVILQCLGEHEIPNNFQKIENVSVELIVGSKKYNLKDLVIVEPENSFDEVNFKGFLRNLGTSVSATYVENRTNRKINYSPMLEVLNKHNDSENICHTFESKEFSGSYDSDLEIKLDELGNIDEYIIVEGDDLDNTIIHITDDSENIENVNNFCKDSICIKYECNACKKICNSKLSYQKHIDLCGKQTVFERNVKSNVDDLMQSAANLKYKCDVCKRIYSSKTRYEKHMKVCGKQYKLIRDKHGEARLISKFQCEYCSMSFKELKFLNYHVKMHKIPFFSCEICNQKFKTRSSRNYHRVTRHSESRYVCQFCGKKFATSTTLNVHVQTHDRTAQCICSVCGKTFHYKGGLFYHMKQHTNERKYKCDHCDKCFYTITAKKRHILTHTGVRPYECQYCQKRFFSRGELTKHEYIHTGILPYKCKYCDKGFTSRFNMKVHWCNHPGSFICDYCSKGFVSREILQFHCKIKHKDLLEQIERDNA